MDAERRGTGAAGWVFRVRAALGLEGPEAAALWDAGCSGVAEAGGEILGYFAEPVELELKGAWERLDEVDYLAKYYEELGPVDVGPLVVVPTHREAVLASGQKPLWIDPGMAFGTGHHETTRMALEALADTDLAGLSVFDVGSGSGILAIAADLLGAAESRGVDVDPDTVPIARANAALNRSRATFEVRGLDPDDRADVIVANLYAELHAELAGAYAGTLESGGLLLATGILGERAALVEEAVSEWFEVQEWRSDAEWRLLRAVRR